MNALPRFLSPVWLQALAAGRHNSELLMIYLPRAAAAELKALAAREAAWGGSLSVAAVLTK